MSDRPLRALFKLQGREVSLSLDEARELIREIRAAINVHLVKCPTCRCHIFPGQKCSCCVDLGIPDPEPFI